MRPERQQIAVHATAVAIGERGLLIQGASRSGKSRLASALIALSTPETPIMLVGDDRILLRLEGRDLTACPHPRIAGFIERRGLGLCASPYRESIRLFAIVQLGPKPTNDRLLANFPVLAIVEGSTHADVGHAVLSWFSDLQDAADAPQVAAKVRDAPATSSKD